METTKIQAPVALASLIRYDEEKPTTVVIEKTDSTLVILKALATGQILPPHVAPGKAIITCIEGEVAFIVNGEDYTVAQGQTIILPPATTHSVKAILPSKMLIVVSK